MTRPDFTILLPTPPTPICDFCSSPDVKWAFPCRNHRMGTIAVPGVKLDGMSREPWAACQPCHDLILAGDRETLAKRSAEGYVKKYGGDHAMLSTLTRELRSVHDNFWASREGAPVPADEYRSTR